MHPAAFKKSERLTNKKIFEELFSRGNSFAAPPFRLVWLGSGLRGSLKRESLCEAGFSVPKRSFARAVDRNLIKRRIREAYRKNKHLLYGVLEKTNLPIALTIIYTAREAMPYVDIEKKMVVSLQKLITQIEKGT